MSCWKLMGLHTVTLSNTHTPLERSNSHSQSAPRRREWSRRGRQLFTSCTYFLSLVLPNWWIHEIYTPHTQPYVFFVFIIWLQKKKTKKNYSLHKILSLISYTFRSSTYSSQKLNLTLNTPLPPKTSFSHYYFLK